MDNHQFERLLAGYLEGSLGTAECQSLLAIVETSPERRKQLQEETRLHVLLRETMSEQVEVSMIQNSLSTSRRTSKKVIAWFAFANAAVVLVAVGVFLLNRSTDATVGSLGFCVNVAGNSDVQVERESQLLSVVPGDPLHVGDRIVCDPRARALVQLNDGSMLSLNKGATLTLVSGRPEVHLESGRALFEITQREGDAEPFQVRTSESTVNVMGTVFGLANDDQTELEVYEGLVSMTRLRDRRTVEVGMQQTASTGDEDFEARELLPVELRTTRVLPTDDITLQHGVPTNGNDYLKVEGGNREVFLRFEIPAISSLASAKLLLTQVIDTGSGRLQLHLGDHSDWNESLAQAGIMPQPKVLLDEHRGVVMHGQVVEFDIPPNSLTSGAVTFILKLNRTREKDIWFSSSEGTNPPQLVISTPMSQ
ncbi:MAG: FecR family protein [Planctomycetota bacterium]